MKMFLLLLLVSGQAFAQSPANTTPAATTTATLPGFSFSKLKAKFRVDYFSETLGPSINKWDDNEIGDDGTKQREPMTMYHSLGIRYLLTEKLNLVVNPRVATVIGDRNDIRTNADPHVVVADDWQFGFQYNFYKTQRVSYSQALTHREPFSTKSRNENIDSQVEWTHFVNAAITPSLRLLHWTNFRYYAVNEDANYERHRLSFRTIFNYTLTDKWNTQLAYEFDLQHRNTNDESDPRHRDMNFMKRYHSYTSLAVGYSPTPNLTVMPFIRTVDERNIRNETTIVGLWILGKII
jgi:hypothetical protein